MMAKLHSMSLYTATPLNRKESLQKQPKKHSNYEEHSKTQDNPKPERQPQTQTQEIMVVAFNESRIHAIFKMLAFTFLLFILLF